MIRFVSGPAVALAKKERKHADDGSSKDDDGTRVPEVNPGADCVTGVVLHGRTCRLSGRDRTGRRRDLRRIESIYALLRYAVADTCRNVAEGGSASMLHGQRDRLCPAAAAAPAGHRSGRLRPVSRNDGIGDDIGDFFLFGSFKGDRDAEEGVPVCVCPSDTV